jgi:hypothetical protein
MGDMSALVGNEGGDMAAEGVGAGSNLAGRGALRFRFCVVRSGAG